MFLHYLWMCTSWCMEAINCTSVLFYYAALLPRRGPHIASHSVCPSVCLSVHPVIVYIRTVLRANIQNRKISVFAYGPASRMYFSARAEGRISYGHLGRTNLFFSLWRLHLLQLIVGISFSNFSVVYPSNRCTVFIKALTALLIT